MPQQPPPAATVQVTGRTGAVQVRIWPALTEQGGGGPVLVALHGWTDSGEVFGALAEALGRRWTVLAPDAPAHGGTAWRRRDSYQVADHVPGVLAVLDALPRPAGRRGRVVLLGHSMGGLTAARAAAARPGRIDHLVLEDPARSTPRRAPSTARTRAWLDGLLAAGHDGRIEQLRRENPDWPAAEHEPWARSKAELDVAHLQVPGDWGEPLVAALAQVSCPVLLIRGDPRRGGIVSRTAAARAAAVCPAGCEVLALPAGHNPRREAPEAFRLALERVLLNVAGG